MFESCVPMKFRTAAQAEGSLKKSINFSPTFMVLSTLNSLCLFTKTQTVKGDRILVGSLKETATVSKHL